MLIDTHTHLNFSEFNKDREEVIQRFSSKGGKMLIASTNLATSKKAVDISENYNDNVKAAIGLHPINVVQPGLRQSEGQLPEDKLEEEFDKEKYSQLLLSQVVAIGEIGLDYWKKPKTTAKKEEFKKKQRAVLLSQLEFAQENKLPVLFHCRAAHEDLLEIIENYNFSEELQSKRGVIHCFTGTLEQAKRYLELGFYLGFNGIIFKLNMEEILKEIPLDKILIETDSPYLLPPPAKEKGRCEPFHVKYVVNRMAEIKGVAVEEVEETTSKNAAYLFDVDSWANRGRTLISGAEGRE